MAVWARCWKSKTSRLTSAQRVARSRAALPYASSAARAAAGSPAASAAVSAATASSQSVIETPKTFRSRRVVSSAMSRLLQLGDRLPARRPGRLEVLRADEMHAVVEVHLELAAAEPLGDERLGRLQERTHRLAGQAKEPLEADRPLPRLLDEDGAGQVRPQAGSRIQRTG